MTDEKLKEAIFLSEQIEKTKSTIRLWEKSSAYYSSVIKLYSEAYTNADEATIGTFISFKEIKQLAIERLSEKLDDYKKRYENL